MYPNPNYVMYSNKRKQLIQAQRSGRRLCGIKYASYSPVAHDVARFARPYRRLNAHNACL